MVERVEYPARYFNVGGRVEGIFEKLPYGGQIGWGNVGSDGGDAFAKAHLPLSPKAVRKPVRVRRELLV